MVLYLCDSATYLEVYGNGVWPGELAVLLPPPLHHQGHIEAEQERDGDPGALVPTPPATSNDLLYDGKI